MNIFRLRQAEVCHTPLVGDTTYDVADAAALRLRKRGLFLCSTEIELEHPYYNTPSGRQEWLGLGCRELRHDAALLWQDPETDTVMVRAKINLPKKFESFLRHENERALKLL